MPVGVFPGSFNPPTVAHVTIAEAARRQCGLDRLDLVISEIALGKEDHPELAAVAHRVAALERIATTRPWLRVCTTRARLLADIAEGYDVLVLGADKWAQLIDITWYGSRAARDEALRRLPLLAVAPRPPHALPQPGEIDAVILQLDEEHHEVSATAVRSGRIDWMAPEAAGGPWHAGPVSNPSEPSSGAGDALERARERRYALARAADTLEAALARPAGDADAWRAGVSAALDAVDAALDDHIAEVEGPDGLYAEILERTPRLAHQVEVLQREHVDLRQRVAAIRPQLADPVDERQVEHIREDSLELLKQISRHRHRGADLVFESYDADIGGEGD